MIERQGIMLSVRLMTYNHEPFIEDALNSIFMQEANFVFEIVIGDDFSTDNTLQIIKEFIRKNNKSNILWNLLDRKKGDEYDIERQRVGRLANFFNIVENCKGKYIALLDGDDYWTDPLKLQKQVDFLERNPEYTFVAGNTVVKKGDVETPLIKNYNTIQFEDLLEGNKLGVNTCTLCFRKDSLPSNYLEVLIKTSYGDWAITLLLLKQGNGYFLQDILGVYRQHDKGVWSSMSEAEQINGIFKMYNYIEATYPDYGKKINEYQINTIKKIQQSNYNRAMQDFKQSRKVFDLALFKLKLKEKKQIFIKNLFNNGK